MPLEGASSRETDILNSSPEWYELDRARRQCMRVGRLEKDLKVLAVATDLKGFVGLGYLSRIAHIQ